MPTRILDKEKVNLDSLYDIFARAYGVDLHMNSVLVYHGKTLTRVANEAHHKLIRFRQTLEVQKGVSDTDCICFANHWNANKALARISFSPKKEDDECKDCIGTIQVEYDIAYDNGVIPFNLLISLRWLHQITEEMVDEARNKSIIIR